MATVGSKLSVWLIRFAGFIGVLACFTSCRSLKQNQKEVTAQNTYCHPTVDYKYDSTYLPEANIDAILKADTALTRRYSHHDLVMANAIGVIPLLRELSSLETSPKADARLESVVKHQQILNRLLVASTQISSVAAELDCEGERANRLGTYLDQYDSQRIRRLTLLSIIVGAATTVATTLIQSDNASKVVGIGGGIIGAGFGGLAAFSSNRTIHLSHERNLLTDVWQQNQQSSIYPPFVWYVLNEKVFSNSNQYSVSHNIRQRWQNYVLNDSSPDEQALYFGKGGDYKADDFHARANMLNQLQSSVRSINQELHSLALALAR
ncbi:hypothetical protein [Spirosoma sp. KCTC 42546]|uniref:hypothetical protein n=1 Tax=Spirosoma sp. KCTC 42546 TaxID=2520506 RepID=UPI001FEEFDC9|nr:hypothetical protein [Spirosoma sp. KCTC 42546]